MAALALALEKGEKVRADKEKQMKEEAAVEAVLRLLQTVKVIVSLRTRKPCVKVRARSYKTIAVPPPQVFGLVGPPKSA